MTFSIVWRNVFRFGGVFTSFGVLGRVSLKHGNLINAMSNENISMMIEKECGKHFIRIFNVQLDDIEPSRKYIYLANFFGSWNGMHKNFRRKYSYSMGYGSIWLRFDKIIKLQEASAVINFAKQV